MLKLLKLFLLASLQSKRVYFVCETKYLVYIPWETLQRNKPIYKHGQFIKLPNFEIGLYNENFIL